MPKEPMPPATDDPRIWSTYWSIMGQPWRRESLIGQHRQRYLLRLLEVAQWRFWLPFQGIILHRSDVEWLIAENKASYLLVPPAIDLRGADVRRVDFDGLDMYAVKLDAVQQRLLAGSDRNVLSRNTPDDARYKLLAAFAKGERNFSKWQLAEVDLSELYLQEVNLSGAQLSMANLSLTCLEQSQLRGATLRGASLRKARMYRCNLGEADLSESDITEADLLLANLENATLRDAIAIRANLRRTALMGVTMDGANLQGVDMYGATPWDIDLSMVSAGPGRRPERGPNPAYVHIFSGRSFPSTDEVLRARFDAILPDEPEDPS